MLLDFNSAQPLSQIEAEQRVRTSPDVEDVKERLNANAREFVEWLFSGRAHISRGVARIGNTQGEAGASLSISLQGADVGLWYDHATKEAGDLIGLYQAWRGLQGAEKFDQALREIAKDYLGDPVEVQRVQWQASPRQLIEERKQKLGTKPRQDMSQWGAPVATYRYYDLKGNVVCSTVRFEPESGGKVFVPYSYHEEAGRKTWKAGAPERHRPLYRLPQIVHASHVVLVEGEGKADLLASLGYDATSAMMGSNAPLDKTDWEILKGKTVTIWPDNDSTGFDYARKVAALLVGLGCEVRAVHIPEGKPQKWDVKDCIQEGGDPAAIIASAVAWTQAAETAPKLKLLSLEEIEALEPPEWLIGDVITSNGLSVLWGRSGTYKSFVALDMAMAMATVGATWQGRQVKHGLVVYVAAEGAHGIAKRAMGWRASHGKGLPRPILRLLPHSIVLTGEDAEHLVAAIRALPEAEGRPVFIVLDTLARTFGGADENKTADMNAYVNAADRIRAETGAHVMIVHHAGKDDDKGERGNLALRGAADTVINVVRDGQSIKLINEAPKGKQKDAPEFPDIRLRVQPVPFQHKGETQSTLILMRDESVVVEGDVQETARKAGRKATTRDLIIAELACAAAPKSVRGLMALLPGVSDDTIRSTLRDMEKVGNVERLDGDPITYRLRALP